MEGFRSLKCADVQRVFLALLLELLLTLGKGGTEHGVAVAGQHDVPRAEVEGDEADVKSIDGKTIDDTVGDILLAHGFQHVGNDDGTGNVVTQQLVLSHTRSQQPLYLLGTHGGQFCLSRFGVVEELSVNHTLTVANHPYLPVQTAIDDCRAGQSVFRVLHQPLEHRLFVMLADIGRHTTHELLAGRRLRHVADVARNQQHGIAPIAVQPTVTVVALRRAAVDDSNEIICDDDAVLAFLLGVLGDDALFYNLHGDKVR